ncbi:molybdopterin cofactor-binding domain-containing protein [Micromonospora sp. NPDC047074]|uniref:molybdopterin cofactor-binding domain-containing protein n=1 Tax=Micromonospora sp. NPDC047074 TaxID=3154339 RepID=UPI0033CCCC86
MEPIPRRRFLGYVLAAPILVTAAELVATSTAAQPPSSDVTRLLGLNDIMTAAALPASRLLPVEVSQDGIVSFTLPRAAVEQGITAPAATLVAEELSIPRRRVHVTLTDARPGTMFDQVTGVPNTSAPTYTAIRVAAAVARLRLLEAAAAAFGVPVADLRLNAGLVTDRSGRSLAIGALATRAASTSTVAVAVELAPREGRTSSGVPQPGRRAGGGDRAWEVRRWASMYTPPGGLTIG